MNLKIWMLTVPILVLFCLIISLIKKKNTYDSYIEGVKESGLVGAFTGGVKASAGGIAAAVFFGYLAALISKPKMKKQ